MSYRYQFYNPMFHRPKANVVKGLIIANAVVFILQIGLQAAGHGRLFTALFGMVPELITNELYLWQFVTAMFLHGSFFHILFNMLGLFFFGPELEWLWGSRRFLSFYFITGLLANLFAYALDIHSQIPTIGASGAVLAVLGAYAAIYPDREVILYFFPIKMKYLVVFLYLIPAILGLSGMEAGGGIAHAVHLAGLVMGVAYVKLRVRALQNFWARGKERLRLWKIRRKYRNFKVVDSEVQKLWDDLEDRINEDPHNKHIN